MAARDLDGMATGRGWPSTAVVAAAVVAILLVLPPVVDVSERGSVPLALLLVTIVAAAVGAILLPSVAAPRWRWSAYVCLLGLAAAGVLVTFQLGDAWLNVWLMLAIATGSVFAPTTRAILAVLVVTVVAGVVVALAGSGSGAVWTQMLTVFLTGGSNVVLVRLLLTIGELSRTRSELALRAVTDERERFSRDLHDLLGHTLSVVVVKAEAVRRLVPHDPNLAAEHAREIEMIGRRALTEIREAVHGYRRTSLAAEVDRGRQALESADVDVEVTMPPVLLPEAVDEVLAWVVREGVTNVIRHSRAQRCALTVELTDARARLLLVDDGAGAPSSDGAVGTGLEGLRRRLAVVDGDLSCGRTNDGFRLAASVPVTAMEVVR